MYRAHRLAALSLLVIFGAAACRKKPQTPPTPVQPAATQPDTAAENARRRAEEEARRRAAEEEARRRAEEERRRAIEAARATLTATIYFDFDKSDLTDEARSTLDAKAAILSANPGVRIRVAGHTDSRGSDEYNLALGQRRAASAKRYLTDRGVDAARIEVVSFGEERPTCTEENESCWSKNRRDEFEITAGGDNISASSR